jgi:hypothetical protein
MDTRLRFQSSSDRASVSSNALPGSQRVTVARQHTWQICHFRDEAAIRSVIDFKGQVHGVFRRQGTQPHNCTTMVDIGMTFEFSGCRRQSAGTKG